MKKLSVIFFILLLLSPLLFFGQSKIGIYGGINLSKLSGDTPEDAKYKNLTGLNAGTNMDIKLSSATSLNMGISYSQQGTKVYYKVPKMDDLVDSLQLRLNYFSIPLSIKVNTTNNKYYAIAGIEAAYLLESKLKSNSIEQNISFNISDFNIVMHFGVGIKIPLGFPNLYIEAKYTQGLINITDEPSDKNIIPRVKTNGFTVSTGIEIPLSKNENKK